jgi:hypothetical protein
VDVTVNANPLAKCVGEDGEHGDGHGNGNGDGNGNGMGEHEETGEHMSYTGYLVDNACLDEAREDAAEDADVDGGDDGAATDDDGKPPPFSADATSVFSRWGGGVCVLLSQACRANLPLHLLGGHYLDAFLLTFPSLSHTVMMMCTDI